MARRHARTPENFRSLFLRLEEVIAASSGADIFGEALKLVAAKLYAEGAGAAFDLPVSLHGAARTWPAIVPDPQLQVPAAVVKQCAELLAPFELTGAGESLDALFETLVSETSKGRKGQYFTPRFVVDFCLRLAQPRHGDRVLDPACGSGAFLSAAIAAGAADVAGTDIDERAVRVAQLSMIARRADPTRIVHADALRTTASHSADVVLSNPPFAGDIVDRDLLGGFALASPRGRTERDVLFLETAVRALRPGGTLAIVLPHNKFAGRATRRVRDWLLQQTQVLAVVGLGRNTFLPHTHQKANVLLARKRTQPVNGKPERIFFAQSERDGKDTRGAHAEHDLGEIADRYAALRAGD